VNDQTVLFYDKKKVFQSEASTVEPATCVEAEPFALRVLDDSMQPEFRKGCIIVIDPTGRAADGSYVLAKDGEEGYLFRQLKQDSLTGDQEKCWKLTALNTEYPATDIGSELTPVVGVIVQRAGIRRSYHKRYD